MFLNRSRPTVHLDHQPGHPALTPSPLTIRLRHVDIELAKLAARPRTETILGAIDFWLDRRLKLRPGAEGGAR
ncbi:hypothetical protein [Actinoplanes palleronii]|uniref:Uncharacterized protein n=1 Tax=Actinoplanes palleronii TaxID=113570 RepID=A0ABQ4BJB2_9ACTN|nr:hypothetical protein [Actinoplanes palleronii]GIE70764.1 hypothetical protein Apa02nite_068720 [Actinoplanes palleronii]